MPIHPRRAWSLPTAPILLKNFLHLSGEKRDDSRVRPIIIFPNHKYSKALYQTLNDWIQWVVKFYEVILFWLKCKRYHLWILPIKLYCLQYSATSKEAVEFDKQYVWQDSTTAGNAGSDDILSTFSQQLLLQLCFSNLFSELRSL